ncbi:MAG: AAA family ATPase [Proteobacteria bacterium]|nr:AAA family ATPase [Pseudomonadota bacterium]
MRLTGLELFGFKSFLNRTVFHFDHGISSIVGPNGCGKSNIVDAIVWASGERGTKSLRVKDMGDVIFHGSDGKRPVNIAEVAIELSDGNKDFIVKRRIYRDGLNEYYLNGTLVRLKDIQDFFLGSGIGLNAYAIVEQGKIESFIQMKPHERRVVIEETSGITRFEEKKREAIVRMEEVKANLERVEDIYSEVVRSLEKAETEWDRWKIYKSFADQQAEIDSLILIDGYKKLTKKINKAKEKRESLDTEAAAKEEEKNKLKRELAAKEEEFSLTETVTRQLEVDIKGKEKDMENRLLEIDYIGEEEKRFEKELEELIKGNEKLEEEITQNRESIEILRKEQGTLNALLNEGETEAGRLKTVMEGLKTGTEDLEKTMEEERVKLFVVMSSMSDINNRISEIERAAKDIERRKQKKAEERQRFKERMGALESKQRANISMLESQKHQMTLLMSERNDAFTKREHLNSEIGNKKRDLETLKAEKKGKEEFLRQMNSFREDVPEKLPNTKKLIDMIKADEGKEKPLERFFSREMGYHVLTDGDTDAIAATAMKYDENFIFFPEKGVFTFNGEEVDIHVKWISGIEEGLARIEEGEEGIFINEDVLVDSRGFILQERAEKRIDIKQFREMKRIQNELKAIQMDIDRFISMIKGVEDEFYNCDKTYKQAKRNAEAKEDEIKKTEKEMAITETEIKTARERLVELDSEIDIFEETPMHAIAGLLEEKETYDREKEGIEEKIGSLKKIYEDKKKAYEAASSDWHEITIDMERKRGRIKSAHEDIERKEGLIRYSLEEIYRKNEKAENIKKDINGCLIKKEELEKDYGKLKVMCEKDIGRYEELKETSGTLHMERHNFQENIDAIEKDMERVRSRKENIETEIAVFIEKLDTVVERLINAYGITNPEEINIPAGRDLENEREKIIEGLSDLGEVNFRAEKEYSELKERAVFLENQKEDLKNAMDSLKKTILKIDSLSKEIFFETFETVNDAFKKFTFMLFKGGNGYLSFNHDIAGVDMFVQPPGKKTTRMELLSGGEKTLISLSLLLALMDTKPSPLSLMDEIDAPLDDANIMSLMEIIKIISSKTQIVLITHNRITMEFSNTIYGITMEEEGISKVVSVRL